MSRREKITLAAIAAPFAILAMLIPPEAHASPIDPGLISDANLACTWLDVDSSPQSFMAMMADMDDSGLSDDRIVATLTYAMTFTCPWYSDEMKAAHDYYVGNDTPLLHARHDYR